MENKENTAPLIFQKIPAIMAEVPVIGKNKRNAQQGFNYRGIDDVQNALQNILPKHGVFYVPEILESHREERTSARGGNLIYTVLKVKYTFYATDGSSVSAVVQSEGMDSADKSSNKAMSAACKYALFQVFNIATEEMVDPDSESPEQTGKATNQQPQQQAQDFDEAAFLQKFAGVKEYVQAMNPAHALKVEDSEGVPYAMIPTKDLRYRLNALLSCLHKNGLTDDVKQDKIFKLSVINAVLLYRKQNLEAQKPA